MLDPYEALPFSSSSLSKPSVALGFLSVMKAEPKLLATENVTSHPREAGKAQGFSSTLHRSGRT